MKFNKIYCCALGVLALGALVQSCNTTKDNNSEKESDVQFDFYTANKAYTLENSSTDYDSETDLTMGCKASLFIPVKYMGQDMSSFRDSIFMVAFDTVVSTAAEGAESYFAASIAETGYDGAELEATPDAKSVSYDGYVETNGVIAAMSPSFVSYAITQSVYYPRAAHGLYGTRYVVYSTDAAKVVTLADLFTTEGLEALPSLLSARAVSMQGVIGQTDIRSLPAFGNFFISNDENIVFAYQPYEVASYAQGEINVPLQPYAVSDYLTAVGKAMLLNE